MEETLGKRISANRKKLGLTQDALAEQLGVTAQAVSKWENDQSCPDITMLPRLAKIFGITTDELLGVEPAVHTAEVVTAGEDQEPEGFHFSNGGEWELHWDSGRRGTLGLALWISLTGILLLMIEAGLFGPGRTLSLWDILLPAGVLVFGLLGLYPNFSLFRLGCALAGGYYLLSLLDLIPFSFRDSFFPPLVLILLGAKLLTDALKRPKNGAFHFSHDGHAISGENANYCRYNGDYFTCAGSFGEKRHRIQLPLLSGGDARMTFGEMTIDLTGCEALAEGAAIDASCAFGEMEILVPRQWRVIPTSKTSFASVDTQGASAPDAEKVLGLNCNVSFGQICIRYI